MEMEIDDKKVRFFRNIFTFSVLKALLGAFIFLSFLDLLKGNF